VGNVFFRLALLCMFAFGTFDMVRGVAAPAIQAQWHLNYWQLGNMFSGSSLGYLIGSFVGGLFIDRIGVKTSMWLGSIGVSIGVLEIATIHSYLGLFCGFIVTGLFTGWLEISANRVIPAMELDDEMQAKHFNWLHGFYGIGAFLAPLLAAEVIRIFHYWQLPYFGIAAVFVVITALVFFARWPKQHEDAPIHHHHVEGIPIQLILKDKTLWLLTIGISTYVMAEVGLASWLPLFVVHQRHWDTVSASRLLSGFYLVFTVTRLSAHWWLSRTGEFRALLLSCALAIVLFIAAVFAGGGAVWLFVPAGAAFAVIFPTIAAIATRIFKNDAGKVLGLLFSASGIGSLLVNTLIGFTSASFGLTIGFALNAAFLMIAFVCLWIVRQRQHQKFATVDRPSFQI